MTEGCPMLVCSIAKGCMRKHDCRKPLSPREYALSQFARTAIPPPEIRERNMVAVGLGYREMIAIALEMYAVFATGFICGAALIGAIWAVFG